MKILHLSHTGLEYDSRIQKAMNTCLKNGLECSFYDLGYSNSLNNLVISGHLPFFWNKIRDKVDKLMSKIKPDIIHAHDIYAAEICRELKVPFIFDSHENWLDPPKHPYKNPILRYIKHRGLNKFSELCKEIITETPTLTVNETILELYKKYSKHVYLLPNYITLEESNNINFKAKKEGVTYVYVGNDYPNRAYFRNIDRLVKLFLTGKYGKLTLITNKNPKLNEYVTVQKFMEHRELLNYLTQFTVGLLYYEPCTDHHYFLANKFSEYAHAGLCILYVKSLTNVARILGDLGIAVGAEDLEETLKDLRDRREYLEDKGEKIRRFAVKNLIWELYEDNILKAYNQV
ncbi:MAG: glycosyltransferase [Candidatus Odinarchaeum yellowstonii]|uniref:Glycosyltransferase n=1 Tax=Odinarchaeota yellowstonii (strain LCB_4) TaxID=1841599 RepID=A0AAF0D184_ODILC|nr:MAG: glycosyltransferase [Candidatus Odinarchaeum yellowstonii]